MAGQPTSPEGDAPENPDNASPVDVPKTPDAPKLPDVSPVAPEASPRTSEYTQRNPEQMYGPLTRIQQSAYNSSLYGFRNGSLTDIDPKANPDQFLLDSVVADKLVDHATSSRLPVRHSQEVDAWNAVISRNDEHLVQIETQGRVITSILGQQGKMSSSDLNQIFKGARTFEELQTALVIRYAKVAEDRRREEERDKKPNDPEETQPARSSEIPDGPRKKKLTSAMEHGTKGFERALAEAQEQMTVENLNATLTPENRKYYDSMIYNLRDIAEMGKGTEYPFYYLDAASRMYVMVKKLAQSGFDFTKGYKKERALVEFPTSVLHGQKMKLFPVEVGRTFNDRDIVMDYEDRQVLFDRMFKGIPLVFAADRPIYQLKNPELRSSYEADWDRRGGTSWSTDIAYVRKMTKAEREAAQIAGNVGERQWPHEGFFR